MRYFLDTEFVEDGRTIDLLSIGIVAEDGRELYFQTPLALEWKLNPALAPEWHRENVVPHLMYEATGREAIRNAVAEFCDRKTFGRPEFWAYYSATDWVALYQLFGRLIDIPDGWPKWCRDLKQLAVELGDPVLPKPTSGAHCALSDAHWNRAMWIYLSGLKEDKARAPHKEEVGEVAE